MRKSLVFFPCGEVFVHKTKRLTCSTIFKQSVDCWGIPTVCVQLITFWLSHQQPMMTIRYCVWTPSSCSEWAAVRLSSFISWNVTSCISTLVHHMIQSDSLVYLETLSELIITAADFKGRFHRLRLFLMLRRKILSLILNPMKKTHWFLPWGDSFLEEMHISRRHFEAKILINPWKSCKCHVMLPSEYVLMVTLSYCRTEQ